MSPARYLAALHRCDLFSAWRSTRTAGGVDIASIPSDLKPDAFAERVLGISSPEIPDHCFDGGGLLAGVNRLAARVSAQIRAATSRPRCKHLRGKVDDLARLKCETRRALRRGGLLQRQWPDRKCLRLRLTMQELRVSLFHHRLPHGRASVPASATCTKPPRRGRPPA